MPDISEYRGSLPKVKCAKCEQVRGNSYDMEVHSTAMHFGLPPTKYGVILVRAKCHGAEQDFAVTFKWLQSNKGRPITAFADHMPDYGLIDMIERDGFSLPTSIKQCAYQLESGRLMLPSSSPAMSAPQFVNPAFLRRMEAEIRDGHAPAIKYPKGALEALRDMAIQLHDSVQLSLKQPVETAEVTERAARLASLCMRFYESFGTPQQRPTNPDGSIKWIDQALPSSVSEEDNIEWDRMSEKTIDTS